MEIEEPVALAKLPRPFQTGGRVQFGSVWGIHGQVKKRRHELCTAVDGNSLGIYEVGISIPIFERLADQNRSRTERVSTRMLFRLPHLLPPHRCRFDINRTSISCDKLSTSCETADSSSNRQKMQKA